MDEVGSSIFHNLCTTMGYVAKESPAIGAKKITFSQCEYTTKINTKKLFVYFIQIMCISSIISGKNSNSRLSNLKRFPPIFNRSNNSGID